MESKGAFLLRTNRMFARVFLAYAVSILGDWVDEIAMLMLFSFAWQADPWVIALIPLTYAVPGVLFSQIAGIFADRHNKLRLMFYTNLLSGTFTLAIVIVNLKSVILLLLVLRSTVGIFSAPAQQAVTRELVTDAQLLKATALNNLVLQLAKIMGPLLGTLIITLTSPKICIALNGLSFFLAAFVLPRRDKMFRSSTAENWQKAEWRQAWREGWSVIFSRRLLLTGIIYVAIVRFAIFMVEVQLAVLIREQIPNVPEMTGWLISMLGIGAFTTVMAMGKLKELKSYGRILAGSTLLIGTSLWGIGIFRAGMPFGWPLFGALLGGIGTGLSSLAFNYLLQRESPRETLGRVSGIFETVNNLLYIFSPPLGGILVMLIGAARMFRITGIILLGIGLIGLSFGRMSEGRTGKNS